MLASSVLAPTRLFGKGRSRVRPGDPSWPSAADWDWLDKEVGDQLMKVRSPLALCAQAPSDVACGKVLKQLKNPYFLGDEAGLTQTLGWVDAWTFQPSTYAVAVRTTEDVVAAVKFARKHDLRLAVKGGGHSYQGTSNVPDSLLIWTRKMDAITLHDAFIPAGCAAKIAPQPAVTVEAGAIWGRVYDTATTKGGRYVQGGGCLTVGVAGLIQSGGFGSFSKAYGLAAASLLEAEVVTADATVRIANACTHPELFWGLKGGGGGSLGVVTRLTLRTHTLPEFFGAVFTTINASSDRAFRRLISKVLQFYSDSLLNPHWGEQIVFRPGNVLVVSMVFQDLTKQSAEMVWRPFFSWIATSPQDFAFVSPPMIVALPARHFWDPEFLEKLPGIVLTDDRLGAPATNIFWSSNLGEAGQVLHAYQSTWLPVWLLEPQQREKLAIALFAGTRHWSVSLHFNKGLAGAAPEIIERASNTAMSPAVLDAFALAISGAEGPPAYPGITGNEPDIVAARQHARAVGEAMLPLRDLLASVGSYVAEANYFEKAWQQSFWGLNYPRLLAVKDKYDPDGLFIVHHGVGSERWIDDGFVRI
jgi:FAD/FMN-containing dehydrogenase